MEKKIFNLEETLDSSTNRVDKFLQSQLKNFSRTKLQRLIKGGFVRINDITTKETSKKIKLKDKIEISFPETKQTYIKPYKMPLNILYEDNDIIVINKSPGVVVHPGAGNYEKTLVNGLLFHCKNNLSEIGALKVFDSLKSLH